MQHPQQERPDEHQDRGIYVQIQPQTDTQRRTRRTEETNREKAEETNRGKGKMKVRNIITNAIRCNNG